MEVYSIGLLEDSVKVEVHFMKDFISTGWAHYVTFGKSYAGGWATREALYSVDDAYDRESENFNVSYLTHEGQHFADYKSFPALQQTDLEYRAKLIELIKSNETTHQLIEKFLNHTSKIKGNAHAFANHCVIRDLSKLLFKEEFVSEKETWLKIDPNLIREKSLFLFQQHTEKLEELGSEQVTELIH